MTLGDLAQAEEDTVAALELAIEIGEPWPALEDARRTG
jgi:hypothetical protein